jgi:hypothetical protein
MRHLWKLLVLVNTFLACRPSERSAERVTLEAPPSLDGVSAQRG